MACGDWWVWCVVVSSMAFRVGLVQLGGRGPALARRAIAKKKTEKRPARTKTATAKRRPKKKGSAEGPRQEKRRRQRSFTLKWTGLREDIAPALEPLPLDVSDIAEREASIDRLAQADPNVREALDACKDQWANDEPADRLRRKEAVVAGQFSRFEQESRAFLDLPPPVSVNLSTEPPGKPDRFPRPNRPEDGDDRWGHD